MKSVISWLIVLVLAYALQSSLIYQINYQGISVNLMLIFVIYLSIYYSDKSILFAFFAGVFEDIASGGFVGINAIDYMIIAMLISSVIERWYKDNIILPLFLVTISTVFNYLLTSMWIFLLGYTYGFLDLLENLAITLVYNIVFAYPIYYVFLKIKKKIDSWSQYRF